MSDTPLTDERLATLAVQHEQLGLVEIVSALRELQQARRSLVERDARIAELTSDRDAKTKRMWELGHECDALEARNAELVKAIKEHNDECEQMCGIGDQEAVRCKYRPYLLGSGRRCPECPKYMMIECAALTEQQGGK